MTQSFFDAIAQKFGDAVRATDCDALDPWIEVSPERFVDICRFLKDAPAMQFDMLNCVTGIDYFHEDPKKAAKAPWEPHICMTYHLSSTSKKHSIVVKVKLPRWKDDVEGEIPEIASVSDIWRTADWHEREVYDLTGVRFIGHTDLRRILCPDDWVGHPLRKDYKFPEEYHGTRCQ